MRKISAQSMSALSLPLCMVILTMLLSGWGGKKKAAATATPIPPPSVAVSVQTPASRFRSIAPDEVNAAYEKLTGKTVGSASAPASQPVSAPSDQLQVIHLNLKPVDEQAAGNQSVEVQAPASMAVLHPVAVVASQNTLLPAWDGQWREAKLAHAGDCELELDYQWKGLIARVELRPESAEAKPIRLLLAKPGVQLLQAQPDLAYSLDIQARRSGDLAWTPLYHFAHVQFKKNYRARLVFQSDWTANLLKYVDDQAKARASASASPTPKEVRVTPPAQ